MLYEMSWINVMMYNAVIPSYRSSKDKEKKKEKVIKADDPANRDLVRQILFG